MGKLYAAICAAALSGCGAIQVPSDGAIDLAAQIAKYAARGIKSEGAR